MPAFAAALIRFFCDKMFIASIVEITVSKPLSLDANSSTGSERSERTMGKPRASRSLIAGLDAEAGRTRRETSWFFLTLFYVEVVDHRTKPPSSISPLRTSLPVSPVAPRSRTRCFAIAVS